MSWNAGREKSCAMREKMQSDSSSSNASLSRWKRTPHQVMMSHRLLSGTRKWGDLVEREQSDRDSMNRQCLV
jgi:hypothetical protein